MPSEATSIIDITEGDFPLYTVETKQADGQWKVFTVIPFRSWDAARAHAAQIFAAYAPDSPDSVRVREYTRDDWHRDLIDAMIHDEDAARRALICLRPEVLAQSLKETTDAK